MLHSEIKKGFKKWIHNATMLTLKNWMGRCRLLTLRSCSVFLWRISFFAGWFYPILQHCSNLEWATHPGHPPVFQVFQMLTCCVVKRLVRLSVLAQVESLIFSNTFRSHTFVCCRLRFPEWDGGQVHGRKQRERSSAHCIFRSTVNFDLPGTLRIQCLLPLTFGPLLSSHVCILLFVCAILKRINMLSKPPSNSEICYFFIKKTMKSAEHSNQIEVELMMQTALWTTMCKL